MLTFTQFAGADGAQVSLAISPPTRTVEVGQTFTVNITVNPTIIIDTVATDLITFTSGKLGCNNVSQGNLFSQSTFWMPGTIHNASGNITNIVWGSHIPTTSPGTFVTLKFTALAPGMAYINITKSKVIVAYNMTARTINITNNGTITIEQYIPDAPSSFDATAHNRTRIDLSWTKGARADSTYIVAKLGSYPTNRADGTNIYNGSGTSKQHTGLNPSEHWYYRAWSWNETGRKFSTTYAQANAITMSNTLPSFSGVDPANHAGNIDKNYQQVSVTIHDQNGDTFLYRIGGQYLTPASGSGTNATYHANLITPLAYGSNIIWYVNASDPWGYTNSTYNFTVRNEYIPSIPGSFNAQKYNRTQINITWTKGLKADRTYIEWNTSTSWVRGQGNFLYNGTGTSTVHSGLSAGIRYYYQGWSYNATDHVFSTSYASDNEKTGDNHPPVFSSESPTNGTSSIPITQSTVSVLIGDQDADHFSWTIHGTHITTASGTNAVNGTKSASVIIPLPYNTVIVWYVNATDGFNWTNATYHFTTRTEYIPNAPSTFTSTPATRFQINLAWSKGSGADRTLIIAKLGSQPTSRTDGINIYNNTGTATSHSSLLPGQHWYYSAWSWNATDHVFSSTDAMTNATTLANTAPSMGTPNPANGSINQSLSLIWNIPINDANGDTFNWTIQCSNGQGAFANGATNGTKQISLIGLTYNHIYTIWVNATDRYDWTRQWFTFTTRPQYLPSIPGSFTAIGYSVSQVNLTWTQGIKSDKTYIERNSHQTWVFGAGTQISNGTVTSFMDAERSPHTKYFYQAWSWNNTDHCYSVSYAEANATTLNTLPNQPTNERPVNNTPYTSVYRKYLNVTVSDADNDQLTVYFYWGNGTAIAFTTVDSGHVASIYLPDFINPDWLSHYIYYRWYVIVNDSRSQIQSPTYRFRTSHQADVDENGVCDITDVSIEVSHYGESGFLPGEYPWDIVDTGGSGGKVDVTDISRLVLFYGENFE